MSTTPITITRTDARTKGAKRMKVLAIDPGPEKCGLVIYDHMTRRVILSLNNEPVEAVLDRIAARAPGEYQLLACERVQSYGIAGGSLLLTAEVFGRIRQEAKHADVPFAGIYRREVLKSLDIAGRGNRDSLVRARLIEMHGGHRAAAVGKKAQPGPLYGVSGHAWQALGVAAVAPDFITHNLEASHG